MKILFQRGIYYMTTSEAIKNKLKVAIPLEFLYKQPSSKEKISYTLVSLINHDGESLYYGHYVSDVFDATTEIWWHCDDENITQISNLPRGVILERVTKKKKEKWYVRINRCIICCLYQNKPSNKYRSVFSKNSQPCTKSTI